MNNFSYEIIDGGFDRFQEEDYFYPVPKFIPQLVGKLNIKKVYKDREEVVAENLNIVTNGMAINLANFFIKASNKNINSNKIRYAQLGTSTVNYNTIEGETKRVFYQLGSALQEVSSYGTRISSKITNHYQTIISSNYIDPTVVSFDKIKSKFLEIPRKNFTRKKDNALAIRIVIENGMANGKNLSEIGLFADNPFNKVGKNKQSVLIAYKNFTPIAKTAEFSIVFDWIIQIVDTTSQEDWQTSGGGVDNPSSLPPLFSYGYESSGNYFTVNVGAPIETLTPILLQNIVTGTIGFPINVPTLFGASVDPNTGVISFNPGFATPIGTLTVSARPVDPQFGNSVNTTFFYKVNPALVTPTGAGSSIGSVTIPIPSDCSTGYTTVGRVVVPLSSTDFASSVYGSFTQWMVSGVGIANPTGVVVQRHSVVRDATGSPETQEIIFPFTVSSSGGGSQVFNIWTTSNSIEADTLTLPTWLSATLFYVKDPSGNVYRLNLNNYGNATLTSSLEKSGPYLKTYRLYGRMLPYQDRNGTSISTSGNVGEIRPYALGIKAFITVKKNDPIVTLDIEVSNGNYLLPGLNDVVANPTGNYRGVLGNFYYKELWMDLPTTVSAVLDADRYSFYQDTDELAYNRYHFVNPYPRGSTSVHCFPKVRRFIRRMSLFHTSNTSITKTFAQEVSQHGFVGFPSTGRTWWNIPKWGITKDYAPKIVNSLWQGAIYDNIFGNSNSVGGLETFRQLEIIKTNAIKNVLSTGITFNPLRIGYSNATFLLDTKCPFVPFGEVDPGAPGLFMTLPYEGFRLIREELKTLNLLNECNLERLEAVYNISGYTNSVGDIIAAYSIPSTVGGPTINVSEYKFAAQGGSYFDGSQQPNFFFPYFIASRYTNSFASEPDSLNFGDGYNNNYSGNRCPYIAFVDWCKTGQSFNAKMPYDNAHYSRLYTFLAALTYLTNDLQYKELMMNVANHCIYTFPPYPTQVRMVNPFSGETFISTQRYTSFAWWEETSYPSASGLGKTKEQTRSMAWSVLGACVGYQLGDNSWRNKHANYFNFMSSGLHQAWVRQNGFVGLRGGGDGSPAPNLVTQAMQAGHYYTAQPQDTNKTYWRNNPITNLPGFQNNSVTIGPFVGGNIPASSLVLQAFEQYYTMLAIWSLNKSYVTNSTIFNSLASSITTATSSMWWPPLYHMLSGCLGDPSIFDLQTDFNNAGLGYYADEIINGYNRNLTTNNQINGPADPNKIFGGSFYYLPVRSASSVGNPASGYTPSAGYLAKAYSGRPRNEDCWYVLALAAMASVSGDASLITSSNQYLLRTAWIGATENTVNNILTPLYNSSDFITILRDYVLINRLINSSKGSPNGAFELSYTAPTIGYIQRILRLQ